MFISIVYDIIERKSDYNNKKARYSIWYCEGYNIV